MFSRLISPRRLIGVGPANVKDCRNLFRVVADEVVCILLTAEPQIINDVIHGWNAKPSKKTKRPKLKESWDVRPKQPSPEVCFPSRIRNELGIGNGSDGLWFADLRL